MGSDLKGQGAASEPKKAKVAAGDVDPYAFDDDLDKDSSLVNSSEALRFGGGAPCGTPAPGGLKGAAPSPSGSTGSSAYKFKSALLSREQGGSGGSSATPSPDPFTRTRPVTRDTSGT